MNLDLKNCKILTTLVIVVLILFTIIYLNMNMEGFEKEEFVNYPVAVGDVVQLQGGLNNVQVGRDNIPLPTSINNLVSSIIAPQLTNLQGQITNITSTNVYPSTRLIGMMTYQSNTASSFGTKMIYGSWALTNNYTSVSYYNPNNISQSSLSFNWQLPAWFNPNWSKNTRLSVPQVYSAMCLFDLNIPNNILNPTATNANSGPSTPLFSNINTNIIINYSSLTTLTNTIISNVNIFSEMSNNQSTITSPTATLDFSKNYKVDLSASWFGNNGNGVNDFAFQLVQFINNKNTGYATTTCKLLDYYRFNGNSHTQRNISFIVPATPNMTNWAVYLISPTGNGFPFNSDIIMDSGDSVSITISELN